ncbi:MAG TPA: alanine racemase, partial [Candidatus Saccharimonadales bacterium]|nr:alanine racemase [Candidatus Saccharimonadales bacterium]
MSLFSQQLSRVLWPFGQFETYNRIEVSQSAIKHNLELFHNLQDAPAVIPVLKANAYGHGIRQVAKIIAASKERWVPYMAVDSYYEAMQIRQVTDYPVLIMGMIRPYNFRRLKYKNFSFVVSDQMSIESLGKTGRNLKIHIELNTGMNRYGVRPKEVTGLLEFMAKYPNLELDGIMSHLADSDGASEATITKAVGLFDDTVVAIEALVGPVRYKHIAQTAGSVRARSAEATSVRPGIGIFGVNPFTPSHPCYGRLAGLQPVMKFVSRIADIQEVPKGDGISYNYTYHAAKPMRIGIIPIGYYEGVP